MLEKVFAKVPVNPPFDIFRSAVTRFVLDGLDKLDPQFFRDFAQSIEAARRVREDGPVHNLHTKIHRLAEVILMEHAPAISSTPKGKLPVNCRDFTTRLNKESKPKTTDFSEQHVRIAAAKIGYSFEKVRKGRPKKLKV